MANFVKRLNVCAATGSYTDKAGAQKSTFSTIGKAVQWDDGSISLELVTIPLCWLSEGKGNAKCFEERHDQTPRPQAQAPAVGNDPFGGSDPFAFP